MTKTVKIVPPAGEGASTGMGTKVFTADGVEVAGVESLSITISANAIITAEMRIAVNFTDINAHPLLDLQTVQEAAEAHGYVLVPRKANTLAEKYVRHGKVTQSHEYFAKDAEEFLDAMRPVMNKAKKGWFRL